MRIAPYLSTEQRHLLACRLRELRQAEGYRGSLHREHAFREVAAVRACGGEWSLGEVLCSVVAGWRNLQAPSEVATSAPVLAVEEDDSFGPTDAPSAVAGLIANAEADGLDFRQLMAATEERHAPYDDFSEAYLVVGDQQLVSDVQYFSDIERTHDAWRQAQLLSKEDKDAFKVYLALRARFEGRAA